jgi:stage II sporulation protein M
MINWVIEIKKTLNINSFIGNQKKIYIFLIGLISIGILFGTTFSFIINDVDKILVKNQLEAFFILIKEGPINYQSGLINSLLTNLLYLFGIWFLGISIIGLIIIIILLFMKSFIVGFSIGSILLNYKFKGIIGIITYIFPHQILNLIVSLLLSFYAINFSIKLFSHLFFGQNINFKKTMNRYVKILIICLISFVLISLIETFISPFIIKLFTFLIN